MLNKKIIISFLTFCLLSSSIYAKQNDDEKESKKLLQPIYSDSLPE